MLIALSLSIPYMLGLGCLLLISNPALCAIQEQTKQTRAALFAMLLAFGICVDYLLVLLCGDIRVALILGCILSLVGLGWGIAKLRSVFILGWQYWGVFLYLLTLYTLPVVLSPISAWDARSIWLFHGKMIYFNDALSKATGLSKEVVQFSHADYPMLFPVLAAQIAGVAGFWNEYLPKASLLFLLIPPLFAAISFFEPKKISSYFLIGVLFFNLGWLLWDGYMDGYLALYAGLSLLLLSRWLRQGQSVDLLVGLLFLGIVINLKNEGTLFALATVFSLLVVLFLTRDDSPSVLSKIDRKAYIAIAVPALCFLLWACKKASWGLTNDLQLGPGSIPRVTKHLAEGGLGMIGKYLFGEAMVGKAAVVFVASALVARFCRVRLRKAVWFSIATSLVYFSGIYAVYLATTWDLMDHLGSSATRTMAPVVAGVLAAAYLTLDQMEETNP